MPDYAHRWTDKQLESLEKRFQAIYHEAEREVSKKLEDHLKSFAENNERNKKLLADGKLSKEKYDKWLLGQARSEQRLRGMIKNMAADYANADQIAMSALNGYLPEIYGENFNFSTYQIEKGARIDTSFTVYNRQTVERLLRDDPDLLPKPGLDKIKDLRWNRQKLNSAVTQGILQGESIPKIAKRVKKIGDMDKAAAVRNARTAITSAQNAGRVDSYKRAQSMGIKLKNEWSATLDNRTRHSHAAIDGEIREVDEPFSNGCRYPGDPKGEPEEVYNCFIGETKVTSDSDIVRSYKHMYNGELVTVKTAGGVNFTCTPNHPILTPRGWIAANLLHNGDDLLVTFRRGRVVSSRINPNINHVFASMEAIHKFFDKIGGERISALGVNFHGDIAATNVEIITQKRFLRCNWYTSIRKRINKFLLKCTNKTFACKRAFMQHLRRICFSTFGNIRSKRIGFSFFGSHVRHSDVHRFGTVTDGNVVFSKYAINNLPTETMIRGELLDGLSGQVFVDKVVSVEVSVSSCHVYNLQTESGYYLVNSSISENAGIVNGICAIAKNCRCSLEPVIDGFEEHVEGYYHDIDGESYEHWKERHAQAWEEEKRRKEAKKNG